jgi:hypothetical protein
MEVSSLNNSKIGNVLILGSTKRTLPEAGALGNATRLFEAGHGIFEHPSSWKARDGPHIGAETPLAKLLMFRN